MPKIPNPPARFNGRVAELGRDEIPMFQMRRALSRLERGADPGRPFLVAEMKIDRPRTVRLDRG
jgi:hypothetical protein